RATTASSNGERYAAHALRPQPGAVEAVGGTGGARGRFCPKHRVVGQGPLGGGPVTVIATPALLQAPDAHQSDLGRYRSSCRPSGRPAPRGRSMSTREPSRPLDVARLDSYLTDVIAGFRGPIGVRQFVHGLSNPTYLLETRHERYVLRRK